MPAPAAVSPEQRRAIAEASLPTESAKLNRKDAADPNRVQQKALADQLRTRGDKDDPLLNALDAYRQKKPIEQVAIDKARESAFGTTRDAITGEKTYSNDPATKDKDGLTEEDRKNLFDSRMKAANEFLDKGYDKITDPDQKKHLQSMVEAAIKDWPEGAEQMAQFKNKKAFVEAVLRDPNLAPLVKGLMEKMTDPTLLPKDMTAEMNTLRANMQKLEAKKTAATASKDLAETQYTESSTKLNDLEKQMEPHLSQERTVLEKNKQTVEDQVTKKTQAHKNETDPVKKAKLLKELMALRAKRDIADQALKDNQAKINYYNDNQPYFDQGRATLIKNKDQAFLKLQEAVRLEKVADAPLHKAKVELAAAQNTQSQAEAAYLKQANELFKNGMDLLAAAKIKRYEQALRDGQQEDQKKRQEAADEKGRLADSAFQRMSETRWFRLKDSRDRNPFGSGVKYDKDKINKEINDVVTKGFDAPDGLMGQMLLEAHGLKNVKFAADGTVLTPNGRALSADEQASINRVREKMKDPAFIEQAKKDVLPNLMHMKMMTGGFAKGERDAIINSKDGRAAMRAAIEIFKDNKDIKEQLSQLGLTKDNLDAVLDKAKKYGLVALILSILFGGAVGVLTAGNPAAIAAAFEAGSVVTAGVGALGGAKGYAENQ